MRVIPIASPSFGSNTYLIVSGAHALVVDPAVSLSAILAAAGEAGVEQIEGVLLTHGHFDHVLSLDSLRAASGVEASIHEQDAIMLTDGKKNAFYEFFGQERTYRPAERLLNDQDIIRLGNEEITVLHTPGHTQGSVCYFCDGGLITGDTLFAESFGRCDLWGGDMEQMRVSLSLLRELNGNMTIYPGHGATSLLRDALDNVAYLF